MNELDPKKLAGLRLAVDLRRMWKTGIGRYARSLVRAIGREAPSIELVAVVNSDQDAETAMEFAHRLVAVVRPASQYSMREMLATPELGSPIDLWHSPHPYQLGMGRRHRLVVTALDLIQIDHAIGWRNILAREPLRAIITTSCQRADAVVAVSEFTRITFCQRLHVSIDKCFTAPLASSETFAADRTTDGRQQARDRWQLGKRVILYVGMLQPHKNLRTLISAFALLPQHLDATLMIVGPLNPAQRAVLLHHTNVDGVTDRIRLLHDLSDDDLASAYRLADVFVLPSLAEGFGLPVLEAMTSGLPCVVSDIPVLREVAGDAALFVNPKDPTSISAAITLVLRDADLAKQLAARGRLRASDFSWTRTANETLRAYAFATR